MKIHALEAQAETTHKTQTKHKNVKFASIPCEIDVFAPDQNGKQPMTNFMQNSAPAETKCTFGKYTFANCNWEGLSFFCATPMLRNADLAKMAHNLRRTSAAPPAHLRRTSAAPLPHFGAYGPPPGVRGGVFIHK
jgi:hypothetical protein